MCIGSFDSDVGSFGSNVYSFGSDVGSCSGCLVRIVSTEIYTDDGDKAERETENGEASLPSSLWCVVMATDAGVAVIMVMVMGGRGGVGGKVRGG